VERVIQILLADDRDRSRDLLIMLRRKYAVHTAHDDTRLLQLVDQARAEARPYDLALIAHEPPLLGNPQTLKRLRWLAPTTVVVPVVPPGAMELGPELAGTQSPHYLVQPVDPEAALAVIHDLLAERLADLARTRAEITRPLVALGEALLRQPDLERALRHLYQELDSLISAEYLYVALYDRRRGRLVYLLFYDHGDYVSAYTRPYEGGQGFAEWVIANDAPLVSGNLPVDATRRGWPAVEPESPFVPASVMVMPLRLGGQVIGVLSAQSARPEAFQEADATLFGFVADLMSGVVANWWTDLQWQRQDDLLTEFDKALAAGGPRDAILDRTVTAARQMTGMDAAALVGVDRSGATRDWFTSPPGSYADQFQDALADLTGYLAATGRSGGSVDHARTGRILASLGERGVGRVVSHALSTGGQLDSMLWLLNPSERPFDSHDQAGLAAVSRRSKQALAVEESSAARLRERNVFARIAWRASIETNQTLLLGSALNELRKLVPWQGVSIWQVDAAQEILRQVWHEGPQAAIRGRWLPATNPLYAAAGERDRVVRLDAPRPGHGETTARGPAVAVALRHSGAQTPGLLILERAPGAASFSNEETGLLLQVGQVLAAGIDKLRWYALADMHRRLARALENLGPDVWDAAVAVLSSVLPAGAVALLVPDGATWRPLAAALGAHPEATIPWRDVSRSLLAGLSSDSTPALYDSPALFGHGIVGVASLALVPVAAGGSLFGALAYWSSRPGVAGSRELELLGHAARHLAPALLAGQQQGGHVQDHRVLGLVQMIQQDAVSAADTGDLLQSLLLHALSSTPAVAGAVFLREAGDRLVLRADYPRRAGDSLPQEAYNGAAEVLRLGHAQYFSGPDGTLACLPLQPVERGGARLAPTGVLVVGSPSPDAFGPADRDLLSHLATQATGIIAAQQVHAAGRALRSVIGLPVASAQVLDRVPALICRALNAPVCLVHILDRRQDRFVLMGSSGVNPDTAVLADLALPSEDPHLAALFATPPEQVDAPEGAGVRLWAPALLEAAGLRFGVAAPLWVDGRPFGVISLHTFDGRRLPPGTPRALAGLAAELGTVLESIQQQRRLQALAALSTSLVQLGTGEYLPATITPQATATAHLDRLLRSALELAEATAAYLLLRSDSPPGVTLCATAGAAHPTTTRQLPPTVGSVLALSEPRYVPDVQRARPDEHPVFDPATRSSLVLPLVPAGGDARPGPSLGAIVVESPTPLAVTEEDSRVLQALAALALAVLTQDGLVQQLTGQAGQVRALLDGVATLLEESDEGLLYMRLVASARQALDADLVVLHPWDLPAALREVPPQSGNQQAGALAGSAVMQQLVRQVAASGPERGGLPLFVEDVVRRGGPKLPEWAVLEGVRALAVAPLIARSEVVGVLFIAYRHLVRFDHPRREAVRLFATLAATAIKNVREQAKQAAALRGQMQSLSLAAHELREPVDKVHMIIETALNGLWLPMSDTLRERLSAAYSLLDEHYEVLGRVLQLGRLEAGTQDLQRAPVGAGALAQAVIARNAEFARANEVTLRAAVDPLLGPQHPLLDETLMVSALSNLVHNGIKFSSPGGGVVLTSTVIYADGQRQLQFEVADQGIGISADALGQIFEPYYQVDHSLGRKRGGMGLGLPLARLIVELHGGTLTVRSTPGQGSRFIIRLPFLAG
jgi:signal transduction histidine kinase